MSAHDEERREGIRALALFYADKSDEEIAHILTWERKAGQSTVTADYARELRMAEFRRQRAV